MQATALHLIQAADLLKEVASGNTEPCIRKSLLLLGAIFSYNAALARAGAFMTQYAHGLTGNAAAAEHLETIKTVAGATLVG
jgi:hypothetical protein